MHDSYTRTLDAAAASRLRGMSLPDLIAAQDAESAVQA